MRLPNFSFEKRLWQKGFKAVAGLDEVGRGSFAGPVVAGCVVFPQNCRIPKEIIINDSKKVSPQKRKLAQKWVKENALAWGVGEVSAAVIDRIGMAKASQMAFRRAVKNASRRLGKRIDFLLIDAYFIPYVRGLPMRRKRARKAPNLKDAKARQLAIVGGDEKSISIAAASIIAKVYRDNLMERLGKRPHYQKYGWITNKGYGTLKHRQAIKKYGLTRFHRKSFARAVLS